MLAIKRFFAKRHNRVISVGVPENYGQIVKTAKPDTLLLLKYANGNPTNYRLRVKLRSICFIVEQNILDNLLIGKFCALQNISIDSYGITTADVFVNSVNVIDILQKNQFAKFTE